MPPTPAELSAIVRGQVLVVRLDPALGYEQMKTRPAVVVSSDTLNKRLKTLIVVPISSLKPGAKPHPHEVFIAKDEGGIDVDSVAQPAQIRTVDRHQRVVQILGHLSTPTMVQVGAQMFATLGGLP